LNGFDRTCRGVLPTFALALVVALAVAGCAAEDATPSAASSSPTPPPVELVVFGAASLRSVLKQVESAYENEHPRIDVVVSTGSSAALRTQIEQGAPADVFLSADTVNPRRLADAGLIGGDPVPFARNRLAIIVPITNPAGITGPADLARPGIKIIAAGERVPITGYATEAIQALAALPGYPAGFADAYAANVVSREDDVGAVAAKIELREGDAAIVYATDARASDAVTAVAIPDAADPTATYAGAVIGASGHRAEATAFFDWLAGPAGEAILADAGFLPPP
jgi:molybdate transport system substrate-binding protein